MAKNYLGETWPLKVLWQGLAKITEYLPLGRTGNGVIKIVDGILSPGGREYLVSSTLIANETESCQNTENSTPTEKRRRTVNSTGKKHYYG